MKRPFVWGYCAKAKGSSPSSVKTLAPSIIKYGRVGRRGELGVREREATDAFASGTAGGSVPRGSRAGLAALPHVSRRTGPGYEWKQAPLVSIRAVRCVWAVATPSVVACSPAARPNISRLCCMMPCRRPLPISPDCASWQSSDARSKTGSWHDASCNATAMATLQPRHIAGLPANATPVLVLPGEARCSTCKRPVLDYPDPLATVSTKLLVFHLMRVLREDTILRARLLLFPHATLKPVSSRSLQQSAGQRRLLCLALSVSTLLDSLDIRLAPPRQPLPPLSYDASYRARPLSRHRYRLGA
jgi:hypothetical protein